jgi:hypothetical protein
MGREEMPFAYPDTMFPPDSLAITSAWMMDRINKHYLKR